MSCTQVGWSIAVTVFLLACSGSEEPASSAGSGAGQAGAASGGSGTGGTRASAGSGGTSGSAGAITGGSGGASGAGTSGSSGASGSPSGEDCACPPAIPLGGTSCTGGCGGRVCAYEDCDGEGFIQAACAGQWFITRTTCGDQRCGPEGDSELRCAPGTVCIQTVGGALGPYSCVPHYCGSSLIACDCLGDGCPGECTQTGGKSFTCNTCPSNMCP